MRDPKSEDLPLLEDPFTPPELHSELPQNADDRRIARRVDLGGQARYRFPTIPAADSWTHGVVVNLSATGGCFLVDGGWNLGDRLEDDEWVPLDVELTVEGDPPLRLRAELMWVQADHGGDGGLDRVGARFDAITPDDRDRLHRLLSVG